LRRAITIALIFVLALALTAAVEAGPGGKEKPGGAPGVKPAKVKLHARGEAFCPGSALVVGNVVIRSGRCYVVYVIRDARGTFLAFADPAVRIPPGQIVRLSTPAGAKVKGRIFYLVPIRPSVVIVPMNSITLVGFRTEDFGPRLTMTIVGIPAPNVIVTFEAAAPRY
jgi:hypothetical protein